MTSCHIDYRNERLSALHIKVRLGAKLTHPVPSPQFTITILLIELWGRIIEAIALRYIVSFSKSNETPPGDEFYNAKVRTFKVGQRGTTF